MYGEKKGLIEVLQNTVIKLSSCDNYCLLGINRLLYLLHNDYHISNFHSYCGYYICQIQIHLRFTRRKHKIMELHD